LGAGVANWFTEDAADESSCYQGTAKGPAPGAPIAMQLLTLAPKTGAGLVHDSHVKTTVHVTERIVTDGRVTGARDVVFHG